MKLDLPCLRVRNDLLCVEWNVKPYTLTHSLTHSGKQLTRGRILGTNDLLRLELKNETVTNDEGCVIKIKKTGQEEVVEINREFVETA